MNRFLIILVSLCAIVATSCGDDDTFNDHATLYDIVTFVDNTESGAKFTLQQSGDSPLITLLARGTTLDKESIEPGKRVFIGYIPASGEPYTSGDITLIGASAINNDVLRIAPLDSVPSWDNDPIYLNSIWRTGKYINIYCRVSYSDEKRAFILLVDKATYDDAVPQLYLVHNLLGEPQSFTRRAYLSVDISALWDKESCQGVTIHLNDSNLPQNTYTFNKHID